MSIVSIIIPVYNTEHFLKRCIDSILAQTYSDWELVLVDDGSKDSSGKICDEYEKSDSRIKAVHKPNEGVSSARNLGLSMAQGEYVCFIDADDWIESTYLEDFKLDKIKADFYVSGASYGIYDKVYSRLVYPEIYCETVDEMKTQFIGQHLYENGYPWGKIYKASIIHENKLCFNEALSINEDHIFVFQYYCLINNLFIVSSGKYHYTIFDNAGGKLSNRLNSFFEVKLASVLFDEALNVLNKKWTFFSADFIKLKQKFVFQRRLQGIASLVKQKNLGLLREEMTFWRNNSYKPQKKREIIELHLLRNHYPLFVTYIILRLFFKIKDSIPRSRTKLIFADLSKRSTLIK
ncbi:glycosyltransferase family 2 protein [Phocaeicola sp. Sa1CVN1]|uniref:Glycosyltransferase family 2 protein n=1 Tax=Phocaeicola intestinalis TaxID=2762212 RepID=A0ABR8YAH7_9BACT|nr:glycosyltransferase family 2 protein [Phocaeicola intestinalis]MBD8041210.1 glycosyltransferase family 2 protein [Phocaeicola intestinalis]